MSRKDLDKLVDEIVARQNEETSKSTTYIGEALKENILKSRGDIALLKIATDALRMIAFQNTENWSRDCAKEALARMEESIYG